MSITLPLLTVKQAAQSLSLSPALVGRLIKKGEIKACKIGSSYRITITDLQEFLDRAMKYEKRNALVEFLNPSVINRSALGELYKVKERLDLRIAQIQTSEYQILRKTPLTDYVVAIRNSMFEMTPKLEAEFRQREVFLTPIYGAYGELSSVHITVEGSPTKLEVSCTPDIHCYEVGSYQGSLTINYKPARKKLQWDLTEKLLEDLLSCGTL